MPDSFSSYKTQRFRWAYGAVQILKKHWRDLDRKSVVQGKSVELGGRRIIKKKKKKNKNITGQMQSKIRGECEIEDRSGENVYEV